MVDDPMVLLPALILLWIAILTLNGCMWERSDHEGD